ncbi:helix-turn-helix transcriptional regulator [Marinicauda pacifica]|uniref:helix-turn-helix transcriptional regulator n=1 Tax=Marinicauda pacifica TaxID=1133559 RepID=UPI0035C82CF3
MTDGLLPIHEVARLTSLSRSTIYELRSQKDFPEPVKLSPRRVAWRPADIQNWLENKAATAA